MDIYIYIVLSIIVASILTFKTSNRVLTFIFVTFLFAQPALNEKLNISLHGIPIDLQPNRILLIVTVLYGIQDYYKKKYEKIKYNRPSFEIFLYLYFISVIVSIAFNYNGIEHKTIIVIPTEILLFILVYNVTKLHSNSQNIKVYTQAFILLGVASSIIAIYQFFGDSSFLKICTPREAFGRYVRSSAVLPSEYELGYILIFSSIVLLNKYKDNFKLFGFTLLFIAGLITTFHRLDYLIFITCYFIYYIYFNNKSPKFLIPCVVLYIIFFVTIMGYIFFPKQLHSFVASKNYKSFIEERILSDTMSGRFLQYSVSAKEIAKHPLGLGGDKNNNYLKIITRHEGMNITIHNGYLSTSLKYGIFSGMSFLVLIILMLRYFWRKIDKNNLITIYPFFIVFIWFMSNLTNDLSAFSSYFVILVAIITGNFVGIYQKTIFK